MSLLTITADRTFRISPPREASNATHHTSPRRGASTRLIGHVADQAFAPFCGFSLACFLSRHFGIAGFESPWRDVGPRQIVEEAADAARPNACAQAVIDVGVN